MAMLYVNHLKQYANACKICAAYSPGALAMRRGCERSCLSLSRPERFLTRVKLACQGSSSSNRQPVMLRKLVFKASSCRAKESVRVLGSQGVEGIQAGAEALGELAHFALRVLNVTNGPLHGRAARFGYDHTLGLRLAQGRQVGRHVGADEVGQRLCASGLERERPRVSAREREHAVQIALELGELRRGLGEPEKRLARLYRLRHDRRILFLQDRGGR
mmetsp:Transcript_4851/g.15367  ORF Transcript_4851/g.15367 Transcript_4851/m.15367 type:complete len:218 (+) Transcript_4851:440-1093(+)